jgi:hypothetical protein
MTPRPARPGVALLALGALAVVRALVLSAPPVAAWEAGTSVPLRVEDLAGADEFRLLPGAGPVLAERLEAARLAAGGRLQPERLAEVPGVGPALLARWRALRPEAESAAGPERPRARSPPPPGFR